MKAKVTLKELVGTKIIYAALLVCYYWMWARQDWQNYYETIQLVVAVFTVVFFALQANRIRKYNKETKDELAIQNLRRADSLCFKLMIAAIVVIAFAADTFAILSLDGRLVGYALVVLMLILSVLRFAAFSIMDSKGI